MSARLRDIKRVLRKHYGVTLEKPRKGSHWRASNGTTTYPIPAHNGERSEIDDVYVDGLCRAFEIDAAEFRARL